MPSDAGREGPCPVVSTNGSSASARPASRPTLQTVADLAGVSRSLVSLALRGSPKVSDRRREAVLRAVEQLGYRPNISARRLAERRTRAVGVLVNDLRQPWYADVLDGLAVGLAQHDLHMLLGDGRADGRMDERLVRSFLELGVDAFVIAGVTPPLPDAVVEAARSLPTVTAGLRDLELPHVDVVAYEDRAGGALATRHLIERGHRRIAHVAGSGAKSGRLRQDGYRDAMRGAGLAACVDVVEGDMGERGGYDAAVELLNGRHPPTAIFAANDLSAMGVHSAATALGLSVPNDLALVGYDNSYLAQMPVLSMTSVDGSGEAIGRRIAGRLPGRIADPTAAGVTTILEPRLAVRLSSGAEAGHTGMA